MSTKSANEILMGGGGAPRAKFTNHGDAVTGRILAISEPYQEREYDPNNPGGGAPKFYPKSGDPIMTFNVDLATAERDPAVEDDDGTRRVYMDGRRIKDAVRGAIRTTGAPGLEVGGQLTIAYVGDETPGDARSGKKYQVSYVSAANTALMGDQPAAPALPQGPLAQGSSFGGGDRGLNPAPVVQQVPAPVPVAAAASALPPGMTAEQYAAFVAYQQSQQSA